MIDILKAKQVFKEYIKNYNPEDGKIKIKIAHIERVSQIAKKLAEELGLEEEDIKLAELIGLLHDIGRFEQIKVYNTFLDKDSIDHGEYAIKVLYEDGLIKKFLDTDKYDNIIKKSILNHNQAKIEEGLSERENLHSKIIRDADKMDIFYVLTTGDKKELYGELEDEKITNNIYEQFLNDKLINYNELKTNVDLLVAQFTYVYDFNFKQSLDIIKENQYVEKLYNRFEFKNEETKQRMKVIYEELIKYLEK